MDLSNSVVLPREDFIEMQTAAWNSPPQSAKERAGNLAYVSLLGAIAIATVTAATWGWATAVEWQQKKKTERWNAEHPNPLKDPLKE